MVEYETGAETSLLSSEFLLSDPTSLGSTENGRRLQPPEWRDLLPKRFNINIFILLPRDTLRLHHHDALKWDLYLKNLQLER